MAGAAMPLRSTRHDNWLRALGREEMPERIQLADGDYVHLHTFKHDFFAATGLYAGSRGKVVLKLGRTVSLFGLPLRWLGRRLAQREAQHYRLVDDLEGVPNFLGRWEDTGVVHAFVEGHPLQRDELVSATFFDELHNLIQAILARHIAYADLEKRENILVDPRGKPNLIDFQISWYWPPSGTPKTGAALLIPDRLGRWILECLAEADRYHLLKHRRRLRRDQISDEELADSYRKSRSIRWHRRLTRPLVRTRRWALWVLTGEARSRKTRSLTQD